MYPFKELDVVVLIEPTNATHFTTSKPILLPRGCSGTIVDDMIGEYALVEFADRSGRAFAIEAIPTQYLIPLVHEPLEITT
jgi:Domain of unknown function (DUF4926)